MSAMYEHLFKAVASRQMFIRRFAVNAGLASVIILAPAAHRMLHSFHTDQGGTQ
jgi:hypothetical protein